MKRQKKYNLILLLIILVGAIGLGYAALGANLSINGTTNLTRTTWDIHFDHLNETSGGVTPATATAINAAGNTVTYSITLSNPGDFYEFTVDAVNAGTVDGMIESVTSTLNNGSITNLPDCLIYSVTYSDGVEIAPNQLLAAGNTETYKVRIEFKTDIEEEDLPDSNQTLNLAFTVNYVQADNEATPVPHPVGVYTANVWDGNSSTLDDGTNPSVVWIGQAIPNGITTYQTPELAMAALKQASGGTIDRPFYLKHTISNDVVTESYVGFVVTETLAQNNPGMTAGTYYLKGEKTYGLVSGNWQCKAEYDDGNGNCLAPRYNDNKDVLLSAFGSVNCTDYSSIFRCSVSGLSASASSNGSVDAYGGSWYGGVDSYGGSYCSD